MAQYFCGTDCLLWMSIRGRPPVLVDNAYSITYRQQNTKHPLYGFRDHEFQTVAIGRTIVNGLLVLNREFKNELSYALLNEDLVSSNDKAQKERPLGNRFPVDAVQPLYDEAEALVQNPNATLDQLAAMYVRVRHAATGVQQGVSIEERSLDSMQKYKKSINNLLDVLKPQLDNPDINNAANQTLRKLVEETGGGNFAEKLKNTYWRNRKESTIGQQMKSPDSVEMFNRLGSVDLEIHFGEPNTYTGKGYADHKDIIRSIHFDGAHSQSSIDARDTNKISYPFIGRRLD